MRKFSAGKMDCCATDNLPNTSSCTAGGETWRILGYVYFTFIIYLTIGLPLAVLPPYVHLRMGYSAVMAGLVISIQYIATLATRPWAGRISDHSGAKVAVLWGMSACAASGALLVAAAAAHAIHWLSLSALILSRLVLGVGESLGSTGATLWGISSVGPESTAKVISYNGVSCYAAIALGAPLGVVLNHQWSLISLGIFTILVSAGSLIVATRKRMIPAVGGEPISFARVLGRVAAHGMSLALAGVCYSVLATFITLYYASRHWSGGALCLTTFGAAFILARLVFIRTINHFGGFAVARACFVVELLGLILLWLGSSPWMALAGAALGGSGFSLVFPALGVEAVKRVSEQNLGSALGVFTAFSDVSFFLVGPIAGALIGLYGYSSIFLFALISVLAALGIVIVLRHLQEE